MKNDGNHNAFWSSSEGVATLKFGGWMIFIGVLLVIFAINARTNKSEDAPKEKDEQKETVNFKNYETMQDELLKSNISYVYKITVGEKKYVFTGSKCNDIDEGFKESTDELIKYKIVKDKYYKVSVDKEEEITNLYEGLDASFLNLNVLFNNLKDYLYGVEKEDNKRTITYNKEGYQVSVITNLESITNINITNEFAVYNLEFTNNLKCDNIVTTEK